MAFSGVAVENFAFVFFIRIRPSMCRVLKKIVLQFNLSKFKTNCSTDLSSLAIEADALTTSPKHGRSRFRGGSGDQKHLLEQLRPLPESLEFDIR